MANSTITITFTQDLPLGAKFYLGIGNNGNPWGGVPFTSTYVFTWVNVRSSSYQVTKGTPTGIVGERAAMNFVTAFNLDIGGGSGCTISRIGNVVTITAASFSYGGFTSYTSFSSPVSIFNYLTGELIIGVNHPSILVDIFNASEDIFTIDSVAFSAAVVPCTHVKVTITTNVLATKMISPNVINPNTNNPIIFECLRGSTISLQLENANGTQANQLVIMPDLLNSANFGVLINNGPSGATAIVQDHLNSTYGLTLEYSLDNASWQTSDTFNGLADGNYTVYVRDNLGCSFTLDFHIDEFGIQSPYFYISKANSFRFANRITWGDSENYKTDENTLSCEVDVELAYKETQQFQSADIITTQFKSNYSSNVASIIKNDGTIINIPIIQKTNNIGIKDKRDARKYNVGGGKTGVYFISGNTYDYNTNAVISPYSLNGLLPEWAQIGNYFEISGFWYLIEDIVFDETKNADVIVFTNTYTGPEVNVIVGSIYNRFNYEVYEFSIDMVDYIDQKFRVKLENSDPNFTTITHLSEEIWCKVKHDNVLEIRYRNTTNTDIMYSTGIEHKIRIPFLKVSGKADENSETHKTDTDTILLNADLYEADDFQFEPVTKEIWRKIMIALSHEKVYLNGVGYVKNGSFNTEGPLERSNLYVLTASMIKTGNVYNSQTSGSLDFDGSEVEVPGLISTESGFVSY